MKLNNYDSRSGGTGRHAVLRGQWGKPRAGSSPAFGTNIKSPNFYWAFLISNICPIHSNKLDSQS